MSDIEATMKIKDVYYSSAMQETGALVTIDVDEDTVCFTAPRGKRMIFYHDEFTALVYFVEAEKKRLGL